MVLTDFGNLPEGIGRDELQRAYGGVGGSRTRELTTEIMRRLDAAPGLK